MWSAQTLQMAGIHQPDFPINNLVVALKRISFLNIHVIFKSFFICIGDNDKESYRAKKTTLKYLDHTVMNKQEKTNYFLNQGTISIKETIN